MAQTQQLLRMKLITPQAYYRMFAILVTERVCSVVSLIGTSVIVTTFLYSSAFRKPINRLVFYASWGNIIANIATVVSQSGIQAGIASPLCQIQGFLIQWFMPADALWTLAMACNVYLTFFRKYNSEHLRHQEWKYLLFCYGLPFIPSFVYFFVRSQSRGRVYGSAILWCWISPQWDFLRILLFYGPVWLVIFLTLSIYLRTGRVIYRKRRELQQLGVLDSSLDMDSCFQPCLSRTTEIRISMEMPNPAGDSCTPPMTYPSIPISPTEIYPPYALYSVAIEGGLRTERNNSIGAKSTYQGDLPDAHVHRRSVGSDANRAAWVYTKYAMLFFVSLIITWVPSTINRVYALFYPDDFNFTLNYLSAFVLPLQGFWNGIIYVQMNPTDNYTRTRIFDQALGRTLRANSYANFSGCFPTPAKQVPASLESVWRQLNAKLEESARAEFEDILRERHAVEQLNELDRLVGEAKFRRENGQGEGEVAPHTLLPDELYRAHITPYLQDAQATLNAKQETTEVENTELAQRVQAQRKEIEELLSSLDGVVGDLKGAAAAATQFGADNDLRKEAIQMDEDVKINSGK
ncbi:hypothetical protein FE257_012705 [Aspergillus nanangensis]|uniref:G-protein coupled receptors family 2 profile 2 domain-containing protein n=1 Tax=Aspergillus nanangensis TaxID=2582783 RepID=A0AAD4GPU1_ASPNN|nr:hypothetical protein FE257_012705 [Aspergillus nanangensis]